MQTLDVTFSKRLKTAFREECDLFMKSHALQRITSYDVAFAVMLIDSTVFGEEDFLTSGLVTVMNDFTANHMNQDQGTPIP
ncbi:hypothetical protein ILUMI_10655 [Ignelater luminosus]|uniref:Uncharacterized protein n=1 Tax=Ignelater luminosus TaxID=2038154 RepID=A0A8K0D1Z6_IGNLU|nr:hypothetical protein ILUMI_10655 [Ignelater luminosus]